MSVVAVIHPAHPRSREAVAAQSPSHGVLEVTSSWHDAVAEGAAMGADWLWLVVAGVVPAPDALASLLAALELAGPGPAGEVPHPLLLTSRIVASDGQPDPAGAPWVPLIDRAVVMAAAARGLGAVRFARWGSLLVSAEAVRRYGAPRRDFAGAADDLEWTGRILRGACGYAVPESVAVREDGNGTSALRELGGRARMLRLDAWEGAERPWFVYETLRGTGRTPSRNPRPTIARLRRARRLLRR